MSTPYQLVNHPLTVTEMIAAYAEDTFGFKPKRTVHIPIDQKFYLVQIYQSHQEGQPFKTLFTDDWKNILIPLDPYFINGKCIHVGVYQPEKLVIIADGE